MKNMREILFRGKTVREKWVYGLLAHIGNAWYISNKAGVSTAYEVIPSTVGQYTGLTDKNGTKIFEGDIIKAPDNVGYEVKWQPISASWQMKNERLHCLFYIRVLDMFEVIGNIHENPDLLKGEAE